MEFPEINLDEMNLDTVKGHVADLLSAIEGPLVDLVSSITTKVQELVPEVVGGSIPDASGYITEGFSTARSTLNLQA